MKPIELSDILRYRFLSAPRFAPGGKRAAFVVSEANEEENCYESRLWLYEDGGLRQLTDLGKEKQFIWLDDDRLLFPAARSAKEKKRAEEKEESTTFYVLDLRGGEALPLFTLPLAVTDIRLLDETHFAVTAFTDKLHPALWKADEAEREAVRKEREENQDYEVFDELPFWSNGDGVINGRRRTLFLVETEPLKMTAVTAPPEELLGFAALGDEVFCAVRTWTGKRSLRGFILRAVNRNSGEAREVAVNDTLMFSGLEAAGGRLYLFAAEGDRHGLNENAWVYTVDPDSGEIAPLRREEYNLYNSVGSDCRYGGGRQVLESGGKLFHLATREGSSFLHRLDPDGSDVPLLTREGSIDSFDVAGDTALCVALYDMRPQELYLCDLNSGETRRVSDFNGAALQDRYVARPVPLSVNSAGWEINGWVLLPKDFDPAKKFPAVLDIHGGPKTAYGPVFYHEMQAWAGRGYFVCFCNPKGSDGRDNAFADIRGEYGETDYRNLMDFTDAVLAAYPQIDPSRVCVTGGSYGGFMTNWIIGHTSRFCCAASQRSISNWISFYCVSDIGYYFGADQTGAEPYGSPERAWAQSPLKYAKFAVTPTLFIHSDEDYRCPLEQGIQMYSELLDRGITARLCLFHGENHELSRSGKPKHRLRRLREITEWFDRWSG